MKKTIITVVTLLLVVTAMQVSAQSKKYWTAEEIKIYDEYRVRGDDMLTRYLMIEDILKDSTYCQFVFMTVLPQDIDDQEEIERLLKEKAEKKMLIIKPNVSGKEVRIVNKYSYFFGKKRELVYLAVAWYN